ncbi:MAG: cation transporter [Elusimicrobia bacterium]|nr:MAG: cation transporter [Elusimicrobiota bacterium]
MSSKGSSRLTIIAALIGNALISVTKLIAAAMTGSSAMLSEGIHSIVDTGNQVLLLYGLKRAELPPDEQFPFGHGKEVYFWSFVVAILIFGVGAGVSIFEGVSHLLHPKMPGDPFINYVVLGLAVLFEGAAWIFALREFTRAKGKWGYFEAVSKGKDPSIFVVLFEDSAALLGIFIALGGIYLTDVTGDPRFDGGASVLIGLILAGTASWLAYETKGLLIGERANPEIIDGIRKIAADHSEVTKVNEVLTMHMGPEFILVNMSLTFVDAAMADDIEIVVSEIDAAIKKNFPRVKRIFLEAEDWEHGARPQD